MAIVLAIGAYLTIGVAIAFALVRFTDVPRDMGSMIVAVWPFTILWAAFIPVDLLFKYAESKRIETVRRRRAAAKAIAEGEAGRGAAP